MFATLNDSSFWLGIAVLALSILGSGLGLAFRLGSLNQRMRSVEQSLEGDSILRDYRIDVDRRLRRLEYRAGYWSPRAEDS